MLIVTEITKTCNGCPAQWEGTTQDGKYVYARYRWGFLRVSVFSDSSMDGYEEEIYAEAIGRPFDGEMNYGQLQAYTVGVVEWPEVENMQYPESE